MRARPSRREGFGSLPFEFDCARVHHSNVRVNDGSTRDADVCGIPCFKEKLVTRLRRAMPDDQALDELQILFAALADKNRLKILHALRGGEELCVCDVAHVLGTSVSAASHHLRKLRDLRILKYRTDGKMAYYALRRPIAGDLLERALRAAS